MYETKSVCDMTSFMTACKQAVRNPKHFELPWQPFFFVCLQQFTNAVLTYILNPVSPNALPKLLQETLAITNQF